MKNVPDPAPAEASQGADPLIPRPKSRQPTPPDAQLTYQGKLFSVYQWQQKMYDGSHKVFEKIKRPDTVVVFAILSDGKILLTKQEQPGKDPFIGAVGGRIDKGEGVLEAAAREMLEETGYKAERFTIWHAEQPVSKIDWAVYFLLAKGLKRVSDQSLDSGEKINLMTVSFDEFIDTALTPEFSEKEIVKFIYEAKIHPDKMNELKRLFDPGN